MNKSRVLFQNSQCATGFQCTYDLFKKVFSFSAIVYLSYLFHKYISSRNAQRLPHRSTALVELREERPDLALPWDHHSADALVVLATVVRLQQRRPHQLSVGHSDAGIQRFAGVAGSHTGLRPLAEELTSRAEPGVLLAVVTGEIFIADGRDRMADLEARWNSVTEEGFGCRGQ